MKRWNAHAWYCVGILAALLIGTLSVKWNTVDRLPEIIGFAVGLSSLILSIFTIIQSVSGNTSAEATLGAVRETAGEIKNSAIDLTSICTDLRVLNTSIIDGNERNYRTLSEINKQMKQKSASDTTETSPPATPIKQDKTLGSIMTVGGGAAMLAACLSFRADSPFKFSEIFPDDTNTSYETGFLAGLQAMDVIQFSVKSGLVNISKINGDIDTIIKDLEGRKFNTEGSNKEYRSRIDRVKSFFV
jgi:hypothetical protein